MGEKKQLVTFGVTVQELLDLVKVLPRAIAKTVKRAMTKDWRRTPEDEERIMESFAKLEGALPAGFRLIYESKDGKMCLYQDKEGHLIAADATKFV